jgi:hypothetical protein
MEIIGSVAAILDDSRMLVKLRSPTKYLGEGQTLTIFAEVVDSKLAELGVPRLYVPKGDVHFLLKQEGGFAIVERFVEPKSQIKRVRKPSLNPFSDVFGTVEETEVPLPGTWSVDIDKTESLQMQVNRRVQVGDLVGEK